MAQEEAWLHIRPGMDVYSAYQDQYIGSVIEVWRTAGRARERGRSPVSSASPPGAEGAAAARETGSAPDATKGNPALTHEEEARVDPTMQVGREQLGEEMGPFPTMGVGNTGPRNQSAAQAYGTMVSDEGGDAFCFAVRPGRINFGPLTRPLYIPTTAVCSVSMERVVLAVQKDQIPPGWRRRPGT